MGAQLGAGTRSTGAMLTSAVLLFAMVVAPMAIAIDSEDGTFVPHWGCASSTASRVAHECLLSSEAHDHKQLCDKLAREQGTELCKLVPTMCKQQYHRTCQKEGSWQFVKDLGASSATHDSVRYGAYGTASRGSASVRLMDGSNPKSGRLEVKHNGQWGTVCDDSWDMNDARVACKQLNAGGAVSTGTVQAKLQGKSTQKIWMDDVKCTGKESSLSQLSHGIRQSYVHL